MYFSLLVFLSLLNCILGRLQSRSVLLTLFLNKIFSFRLKTKKEKEKIPQYISCYLLSNSVDKPAVVSSMSEKHRNITQD